MTAVANTAFTAAQFNTHLRDNLNQTAPAKATAAGQHFVATGTNAIAARMTTEVLVAASETTGSTSYTDLTTTGPTVTVVTGALALVWLTCTMSNSTTEGCAMSFAVSNASTIAAADANSVGIRLAAAASAHMSSVLLVTLTAGTNVFTAKYRVSATSTGTFADRRLGVLPL
jgi:hypothetical protein